MVLVCLAAGCASTRPIAVADFPEMFRAKYPGAVPCLEQAPAALPDGGWNNDDVHFVQGDVVGAAFRADWARRFIAGNERPPRVRVYPVANLSGYALDAA